MLAEIQKTVSGPLMAELLIVVLNHSHHPQRCFGHPRHALSGICTLWRALCQVHLWQKLMSNSHGCNGTDSLQDPEYGTKADGSNPFLRWTQMISSGDVCDDADAMLELQQCLLEANQPGDSDKKNKKSKTAKHSQASRAPKEGIPLKVGRTSLAGSESDVAVCQHTQSFSLSSLILMCTLPRWIAMVLKKPTIFHKD